MQFIIKWRPFEISLLQQAEGWITLCESGILTEQLLVDYCPS